MAGFIESLDDHIAVASEAVSSPPYLVLAGVV